MSENGAERATTVGELAGSGERFKRALVNADIQFDIPREESIQVGGQAAEPKHVSAPGTTKEKKGWLDLNGNQGERSSLERKTWLETYHELNEVMKPQRNRTWGEFMNQVVDVTITQIHPSLETYEPPAPERAVPEWWSNMRRPVARIAHGIYNAPWYNSIIAGGFFGGSATAPLPGPNFLYIPFSATLGAAAGIAIKIAKWLGVPSETITRKLDDWACGADRFVVQPLTKLANRIGLTWLINKYNEDPVGKLIDTHIMGGSKSERLERRIKEREDGDVPFSGALSYANSELNLLMAPGVLGMLFGRVNTNLALWGATHKINLLERFDVPTDRIDLAGLTKFIQAGQPFQNFKDVLDSKGYGCRIVQTEYTVVLEIWVQGGSYSKHEEEPVDVPEPRAK